MPKRGKKLERVTLWGPKLDGVSIGMNNTLWVKRHTWTKQDFLMPLAEQYVVAHGPSEMMFWPEKWKSY